MCTEKNRDYNRIVYISIILAFLALAIGHANSDCNSFTIKIASLITKNPEACNTIQFLFYLIIPLIIFGLGVFIIKRLKINVI